MARRLRVIVPGFLVSSGISAFLGLLTIGKAGSTFTGRDLLLDLLVCVGPLGGPLAEPLAFVDFDPLGMIVAAMVLLSLIALHPWRPGIATGIVSGLAIAVWLLLGLANTYYGV